MKKSIDSVFYVDVNGEYKPLGHIEEVELTTEECSDDLKDRYLGSNEMSFEIPIESIQCGNKNPYRFLASGGDKGRYNGMTLKEDGYLSAENGWI